MCGANEFACGDTQHMGMSVSGQLIRNMVEGEGMEVEEKEGKAYEGEEWC